MHKQNENHRKVFLILKKFTKSNLNKLEKYLKSDYFSINDSCIQLFDFLKPYHPRFSKFKKELAKNHLFPNEIEKDLENELNDIFSNLFKRILDFIALENYLKDKSAQEDYIINHFYQHQFYTQFEKSSTKKKKTLDKQPRRDGEYYYRQMKTHDMIYFHPETSKFKNQKKTSKSTDETFELKQAAKNLEIGFVLSRLRHSVELLQRARIFSEPVLEIPFLVEAIKQSKEQQFYENPIIEIYTSLIRLAKGQDETLDFEPLLELFSNYSHLVRPLERREILQFLLNEVSYRSRFCIKEEYDKHLQYQLQLFRLGEEKDCLVVFKRISEIVFTNIVMIFCKNNDCEFAEKIINKYDKYLPSDLKIEVVRYSKACVYFYRKKYSQALELLSKKTKFTQLYLEHRAKTILLCCQYELFLKGKLSDDDNSEPFEIIENAIKNFIRYYERKPQLAKNKTQRYLNFGRVLKKILEIKDISKNDRLSYKQKIISTLNSFDSVAAEKWLLDHLDSLDSSFKCNKILIKILVNIFNRSKILQSFTRSIV